MNFLQLCQKTREKCGISGTGPAGVTGQSGEMLRLVNWVSESWDDIQRWHEWDWMRGDFSFQTVAGTQAYTPAAAGATPFRRWHTETLRCYPTSVGVAYEAFMAEQPPDWFRDAYMFGSQSLQQGQPQVFAVRRADRALLLGPIPDGIYTVRGQYQKAVTPMVNATDEPVGLPEEFHMIIVWRAAMKYAGYEGAPEVMTTATGEFRMLLQRLEEAALQPVGFSGPLA